MPIERSEASQNPSVTFGLAYLLKTNIGLNDEESFGVRAWRLTAGRINQLALIPFNNLVALAKLVKGVTKIFLVVVTLNHIQKLHKNLSYSSLINDLGSIPQSLIILNLFNITYTIVGPEKDYSSFQHEAYKHLKCAIKI